MPVTAAEAAVRPAAPAPPASPSAEPPEEARLQMLDGERRGMPAVPAETVALLEEGVSDAEAIARGSETTASDVIHEVSSALVRVNVVALVSQHGKALHYPKFRVRYLLDRLMDLVAVQSSQANRAGAWALAQERLAGRIREARALRNGLLHGLGRVTRNRPEARQELRTARGSVRHPSGMAASLRGLARLIEGWLTDPARAPLLMLGDLDANDAQAARAAATALEQANREVYEFPAAARDLPGTNLLEGRLMLELAELHRALETHQGVIAGLPRLPLGDTLRRQLRNITTETAEPDPDADPEPTPTI